MNASLTKLTKCSTAYFLFMLTNNIHQRPLGFRQKPSAGATAAPSRIARLENEGQVNLIMPIRSTSAPIKKRGLFFSAKQLLLVLIVRLEVFFSLHSCGTQDPHGRARAAVSEKKNLLML